MRMQLKQVSVGISFSKSISFSKDSRPQSRLPDKEADVRVQGTDFQGISDLTKRKHEVKNKRSPEAQGQMTNDSKPVC